MGKKAQDTSTDYTSRPQNGSDAIPSNQAEYNIFLSAER